MTARLNSLATGLSTGLALGVGMLAFSLAALGGQIPEAEHWMETFHVFYDLTPLGIVAGIIEAALFGGLMGAGIGWTYNRVADRLEARRPAGRP